MKFWQCTGTLAGILAVFVGLGLLAGMTAFLYLRFSASPPESECRDIPPGTVVLAPAFWNLGNDPGTGKYLPGAANHRIARKLEACADRFSLVLTQKAVSDALKDSETLSNGTPVRQMHKDSPRYVGTLEALQCAVELLRAYPQATTLGLVAHDKHLARCRQALEAVLGSTRPRAAIIEIHLGTVEYEDEHWSRQWCWAAQETLKWPVQSGQIVLGRVWGFHCSDECEPTK
jgi:hypothetical protein